MVHRIEKSLHFGELALGRFFDLEGAYYKARVSTICETLLVRGAKATLAEWVKSALEDRAVKAALGAAIRGDCPQESYL